MRRERSLDRLSWLSKTCLVVLCCCGWLSRSCGSVIVVTNRTAASVSIRLETAVASALGPRDLVIEAGDCIPIPLAAPADMQFQSASQTRKYQVAPGGLYYFGKKPDGSVDVGQIALSKNATGAETARPTGLAVNGPVEEVPRPLVVIPVKILYDDAENLSRAAWESRLRKRFDEVSRLFKKYCFVEFDVVAVDRWSSSESLTRLDDAFEEFERLVDPAPARVAIGFTARQRKRSQDRHLGGTRGPLHTHMLIREHVNKISERESLEILVHELGHFLGAAHSPENNTVMRTILGDRQARVARFRVVFDPLNTMAMCLVSQELALRPDVQFWQLPPATSSALGAIYADLAQAMPGDPAAFEYLRRLADSQPSRPLPIR
jgi:hypothetical protein